MSVTPSVSGQTSNLFFLAPPVILLGFAAAEWCRPFSREFAAGPFLLSLLILGLPHGAIDWLLMVRSGKGKPLWSHVGNFAGYVLGMAATFALLLLFPRAILAGFGALSAWHFGVADESDVEERFPTQDRATRWAIVNAVSRGGLILTIPFAAFPVESSIDADRLLQLLGSSNSLSDDQIVSKSASFAALWLVIALTVCWGRLLARSHFKRLGCEVFEVGAIGLALATLDPLFGVGLYFLVWHSGRHWRRLAFEADQRCRESYDALFFEIAYGHLQSLVFLIPTLLVLGWIAAWRLNHWDAVDLALLTVAVFIVVTPSHDRLVSKVFRGETPAR